MYQRSSQESARGVASGVGGGNDLQFQSFSYGQNQPAYSAPPQQDYSRGIQPAQAVSWSTIKTAFSTGNYDNEPPLLQELGVNFSHINTKGVTVLNPFRAVDKHIMDDTDLAGPIVFCFLFGMFLQIGGNVNFGYVYGVSVFGTLGVYAILNLMSDSGIDIYRTASVLGYNILQIMSSLSGTGDLLLLILSFASVFWCTYSSSGMFVTVLSMSNQRLLIAYPIGLLYTAFAILAVMKSGGGKIPMVEKR